MSETDYEKEIHYNTGISEKADETGSPRSSGAEDRESYWNSRYSTDHEKSEGDNWLGCYMHLFTKESRIIELGCGEGFISEYLLKNGYNVLSTDISEYVLAKLKSRVPEASVRKLDLNQMLPFNDGSFDIIIADLCLHYFSSDETFRILKELKRVLSKGGHLLSRVNSERDLNHGAGKGIEIEKGFYNQKGHYKRFFSREMAVDFFKEWKAVSVAEKTTSKYIYEKHVLQIIADK